MKKNIDLAPFIHQIDHLARGFHERTNTNIKFAEYGSKKWRITENLSI